MAAHELADRDRREIVGADGRQRAAVAADRRAHVVADEGFGHGRAALAGSALNPIPPLSPPLAGV